MSEIFEENQEDVLLSEPQLINRSIVIFHPNEEFYGWYSLHMPEEKRLPLEEVLDTPLSFLIPPVEKEEEAEEFIYENSLALLEVILNEFIDDEELIETVLTEDHFDEWLEYNYSPFVVDLAADFELRHEEDDESEEVAEAAPL